MMEIKANVFSSRAKQFLFYIAIMNSLFVQMAYGNNSNLCQSQKCWCMNNEARIQCQNVPILEIAQASNPYTKSL